MKRHRILPIAASELDAAARWYEEQQEERGIELLAEYRERLARAVQTPEAGAVVGVTPSGGEVRRFRLERFSKYAILMGIVDGTPTVIAFEHSSRRPEYWRDRI